MNSNYPSSPPVSLQSNSMAITSLIVGIFTWVVGFLIACPTIVFSYGLGSIVCMPLLLIGWIVSIITGYSARKQIRTSGGRQTGDGSAVAGIVMGWIGVGLTLLIIILVVLSFLGLFGLGILMDPNWFEDATGIDISFREIKTCLNMV